MRMGELLAELNRRGLEVWAEGDLLRLRGPKGAAGDDLRKVLAEHKGELLELLRERHRVREVQPITRAPRDKPAPLSFGQQRLWFLDQLEPGSSTYNLALPMRVEGALDTDILERCFAEIVQRHEILRTYYAEDEGVPVQIVDPDPRLEFRVLSEETVLALCPEGVEAYLHREGQRPFELSRDAMLRVLVITQGTQGQLVQVCMHHIAADVWARGIIIRELMMLYAAFSQGEPSPLPPLELQYSDFAVWQRGYLVGEVRQGLVDYWRKQLAGLSPLQELPTDHPRPRVQSFAGGEVRFDVEPALAEGLKALGHAANATPFVSMLGAFFVLLHRLSGREDLALGANSINRGRPELEPLVGFFVDNLVMRVDLSGRPSFHTVLERVREVVLGAFSHQDLPFDLLVEELKPPRNLGFNPLFQTVFSWTREAGGFTNPAGARMLPLEFETTASRFDLNFFAEDHGERLTGRIVFNRELFERDTIQRYVACFLTLMRALVTEPHRPVTELPLLPVAERARVLLEWNDTRAAPPRAECLHALFEARAERTPDACALVMGDWELTYGELDQQSDRLAAHLQTLGVGPEAVVGVCLERAPRLIVGLLAVLKAGGAFLPLDPDEAPERLRRILTDARPHVLLTSGEVPGAEGLTVVHLDDEGTGLPSATGRRLRRDVTAENLAYILYTSGSTGQPKGTQVTHASIVNYLRWSAEAYRLPRGAGSPVLGSISFDGTLTSLFAPLLTGRALFLLPRGQELELLASREYPEQGLSFIKMTPSHLRAFEGLGRAREVLERTHAVVLGGEGLHGGDLARWRELGLSTRVINEYGPTEAAVACSFYDVPSTGAPLPERIPIGRPITHTQLYILDRHGQLVPPGVPGELYIAGAGLARGYLGRPDLTAERFVPNPFAGELPGQSGSRLYRTGDVARHLPDGNIEYLGRLDDQLKIRGHRVESGEVESALARHPQVVHAAVVLHRATGESPRLVAYVQPTPPRPGDAEDLDVSLRRFLQGQLPEYMWPSSFLVLPELPLTPSGKVDRKALPAPRPRDASLGVRSEARTEMERQLEPLFRELLGLDAVAPDASFFELGGHSLLAIQLIARIRSALGVDVPLNEIFERPTIEGLAQWLTRADRPTALAVRLPDCIVALKPWGSKSPIFCTPPSAGSPAVYVSLARHLSPEQPLYGFQMPGVTDEKPALASIEETAALFVAGMRQVQPQGPYRIAGWSYGGIVACEMARQLEAQGEHVALLALIDGASLDRKAAQDSHDVKEAVSTGSQLVKVLVQTPLPRDYASLKLVGEWMGISLPDAPGELLRRDSDGHRSYLRRFLRDVRRTARNMLVTLRAERSYTFSSYEGHATLFRAGPSRPGKDSLVESVRRFARSGVEVISVPGNHMTLIMDERNVTVLAQHLQNCLDEVAVALARQEPRRTEPTLTQWTGSSSKEVA
ncbi:amino acid adenylation domain-containing protein [Corallococcus sp. M34]|uniref:non-ribosomal peptide synthetase n=1 Tax=Citreicoccus inhibens TaxID=2849499 RepID=UPI001C24A1C1|nr:amino acid adenylation domain-containing protein [Citreicoccus inhibens]MBU8897893.1 amino acid adenylation domain-containing protein [Citreicoccus inhibens]